jgi:DNA-binding MarR family transcriptional regulator
MATEPTLPALSPDEERTWRSLIRLMVILPRAIDEDLSRRGGISLTRYVVLMRLSEAPGRALRMSDLAEAASISPSRMTRIIQPMIAEGLVTRGVVPGDARANLATLTDHGLQRLRDAWPAHLAGARSLVLDHIDPADLPDFHRMTDRLRMALESATGDGYAPAGPTSDAAGPDGA